VVPRRHEVFIVHTDKTIDYPMPQVGEAFAMRSAVSGSGLYFQQEGPRSMLAGIHTGGIDDAPGDDPNTYERAVQEAGELQIAQALLDRLPGMGEMGLRGGWAGLYPNSPDARPLVGPCNDDGTIVAACGLGGWGVQVSPMIGQLAAEWVAFGELRTTPSAAEFVPMRFVAA
jgi:sarcosine oxidase subunit beta